MERSIETVVSNMRSRYEYLIFPMMHDSTVTKLQNVLNKYGNEGWCLASLTNYHIVMVRSTSSRFNAVNTYHTDEKENG